MPATATRADALRIKVSSVEVLHLRAIGTLPGVAVLAAAARNGAGTGLMRIDTTASLLTWRAPGSSTDGNSVNVSAGGAFVLEDGADPDKWIRVQVYTAYLPPGADSANVALTDIYNNDIGKADLTAAEASAGDTLTWTVTLQNDSPNGMTDLKIWIDASVSDLEISDDGAAWVSPTTEATALVMASLAAAATDTLHLRRTIGAASSSDPDVLNYIHAVFDSW